VDRHFHHAISLPAEQVVRRWQLVEREMVGDQRRQVDTVVSDHRKKSTHALLAARTKRRDNPLITQARVDRFVWGDKFAGIDAQARHRATWTQTSQCGFECVLSS
jgi:hypothetical protein